MSEVEVGSYLGNFDFFFIWTHQIFVFWNTQADKSVHNTFSVLGKNVFKTSVEDGFFLVFCIVNLQIEYMY